MRQQVIVNFTNCKPRDCGIFEGVVNTISDKGVEVPMLNNGYVEMLLLESNGTSAYSVIVFQIKKGSVVVEVTLERQDDVANTIIERRGLPEYKQTVIKI